MFSRVVKVKIEVAHNETRGSFVFAFFYSFVTMNHDLCVEVEEQPIG